MKDLKSIFAGGFVAGPASPVRQDPEVEFLGVLMDYGLEVEYLQYGKLQRVKTTTDKKGEKSGWYIFHPDGVPAGAYGDWRLSDDHHSWCAKDVHDLSTHEILENKARMEQAKRERAAAIEQDQKAAALKAQSIVQDAQPATNDHPYLKAKGVPSYGLSLHDGKLAIPAINERGEVVTIQTIDQHGGKLFLKGGKKSGSFFWIEGKRDTIYICEGYATGATLHMATGCAVAVAFDAGNLVQVAPLIRGKFLTASLVIAADNDQFKGNDNAGVRCAKQAAELTAASVVIPQFSSLETKPTDFNDLAALEGLDRVRQQIVPSGTVATPSSRFELSRVDTLEVKEIDWAVEGYIESDSLGLIFGEPGCGKSFVAIDMACCIATGQPWHGHEVKPGMAIYIAGEGHNGLARRFHAWEKVHGASIKGAPIYTSHRAAHLFDQASALEVAESVKAIVQAEGKQPRIIIIDTVARNMGGDENSTQDMNKFIEHLDNLLRHPYKTAVLCVHHSGKASPGQARGSTALRGALDSEYQVEIDRASQMVRLANRKMKDGEPPPEKHFTLTQIGLGKIDSKGQEIMGAALKSVDLSGLIAPIKEEAATLSKNQGAAMRVLEDLFQHRARTEDTTDVALSDWRDACAAAGMDRNRFHEVKTALSDKGKVRISSLGVIELGYELPDLT